MKLKDEEEAPQQNLAEFASMDIDEIVLVGGSTRVPRVKEWLKEYFNKDEIL